MVLGVRGTQWRVLSLAAQALSHLAAHTGDHAYATLAQASLACSLQACTFTNRVTLASDALAGRILRAEHIPHDAAGPAAEIPSDPAQDAALFRHMLDNNRLSTEACTGLLYMALQKRGGATLLANRLPSYLQTARDMLNGEDTAWFAYEDDTPPDAVRSVQSL